MRSSFALLPLVVVVTACGPLPSVVPDAGPRLMLDAGVVADAGDLLDAGEQPDAGVTPESDAGSLDDAGTDAGVVDAGLADAGLRDAGRADAGPLADAGLTRDAGFDAGLSTDGGVTVALVGHTRELRGVWVSTVSNLDVAATTNADAGIAAMRALVDRAKATGLNALFFQVRPESDAWYRSTLEPWSRFITGTQGRDPGWDPLETLLDLAHERGLEVHAWLNPYRGLTSPNVATAPNHVTRTLSAHAITYDNKVTMNPGVPQVRAHVVAVVQDLIGRYDVDGVHFDDYFYPYPDGTPFPDDATWQAYRATAPDGGLSKSDWRRDNVNLLIRDVMAVVTNNQPQVRFGVSPFGIWRPGFPAGVTGFDAYELISCDGPTWLREGWVDYLAPQLYWATTSPGQPFVPLATWWAGTLSGGRHLFAGHAVYKLGMPGFDANEIRQQVLATRALEGRGVRGGIHFREGNLRANPDGVRDLLRTDVYAEPALPPPLPRSATLTRPGLPTVSRMGASLTVTQPLGSRFFALYRLEPGRWRLVDVRGAPMATFTGLTPGTWAVSAVGRGGLESDGVIAVVP